MASTWTDRGGVDYSVTTGRVEHFDDDGTIFFDEEKEIALPGWVEHLCEFATRNHCFIRKDVVPGLPPPAWVVKLIEDGHIEAEEG